MKYRNMARQAGFTLVEIAIVLVIIGLLLVGVLQGQEMIENGKVKNLANSMKGVSAAYYAYQDRYQAVPGDDGAAATRFVGAVNGGGNGAITGVYTAVAAPAAGNESNNFWQHTRMAGLLTGIATATAARPPTHALGGLLGVQSNVTAAGNLTYGMTGPPWFVPAACPGGSLSRLTSSWMTVTVPPAKCVPEQLVARTRRLLPPWRLSMVLPHLPLLQRQKVVCIRSA